ncbi:MAG TPA: hypothetical protein VLS48_06665, partial [Anaerolineales bacterium]|nr:hypothetical protein [Anaerolineales bacterium]
ILESVAEFKSRRDRLGLPVQIAVDGGINQDNAPGLVAAGADVLIMGTALFRAADMQGLVKEIKAISSSRLCR